MPVNIIQNHLKIKGEGKNVAKIIDDANRRRKGGDKDGSGAGCSGQVNLFENITNVQDSQTKHQEKQGGAKGEEAATDDEILEAIEANFLKLLIICTNEEIEKCVVSTSLETVTETLKDIIESDKEDNMTKTLKDTNKSDKEEKMTETLKDIVRIEEKKEVVTTKTVKGIVKNDKEEATVKILELKLESKVG